jgi:hypothetical protein
MLVGLNKDGYNVVAFDNEIVRHTYAEGQRLKDLNARQLAEVFAQWLGKAAPERIAEFTPALQALEAQLPPEILSAPASPAKPRQFHGWAWLQHFRS